MPGASFKESVTFITWPKREKKWRNEAYAREEGKRQTEKKKENWRFFCPAAERVFLPLLS
jgi:hypothetical protein